MIKQYYRFIVVLIFFILAGIYFFLLSDSGLLERLRIDKETERIDRRIEDLKKDNIKLKKVLEKYKSGYQSEEDVTNSGYLKKDNHLIIFKDDPKVKLPEETGDFQKDYYQIGIKSLRVLWIIVTIILVVILYKKRPSRADV